MKERYLILYAHVVNLVAAIFGITLFALGVYGVVEVKYGARLSHGSIIIGVFSFVSTIVGVFAILKKNRFLLLIYGILFSVIFVLTLICVITGMVKHEAIRDKPKFLEKQLTMLQDEDKMYLRHLRYTERESECCGVNNFYDYLNMNRDIPGSCCGQDKETKCEKDTYYSKGCGELIYEHFKYDFLVMSVIGICALLVQMNATAIALLLAYKYYYQTGEEN